MTLDPIGWFARWIPERWIHRAVQGCLLTIIGAFLWRKFQIGPGAYILPILWYEEMAVFITFFIIVGVRRLPTVRATGWIGLALPCFSAWLPFVPVGGLDMLREYFAAPGPLPAPLCPLSREVLADPAGRAAYQILTCGGTAGLWLSILSLRRSFSVSVEVRSFVTSGIYRWVRHPMYVSEVASMAGFALLHWSPVAIAAWILFLAAIVIRANAEERLLSAHFPEYAAYRARTWALLPIVPFHGSGPAS